MIRTLWVGLNGFVATVAIGALVNLAPLFGVRAAFYPWAARTWSRWILKATGVRLTVHGLEHLVLDRPQIVISNHQSWYDVFAISASMPKAFHFVAKKELERIPLFGRAWKVAGHISLDRSDRQAAIRSLDAAAERMAREEAAVVIFPEGTRSPDGRMLPFKKGAFMLAKKSGVELLPAAVSGSREVMPKGTWRVRPHDVTVRYGEPIPTPGPDPVAQAVAAAREAISDLRDPGDEPGADSALGRGRERLPEGPDLPANDDDSAPTLPADESRAESIR
ncbi:MAG: lysophospholipid acyltransferase family protein [Gemmatimonadota bacterium]